MKYFYWYQMVIIEYATKYPSDSFSKLKVEWPVNNQKPLYRKNNFWLLVFYFTPLMMYSLLYNRELFLILLAIET